MLRPFSLRLEYTMMRPFRASATLSVGQNGSTSAEMCGDVLTSSVRPFARMTRIFQPRQTESRSPLFLHTWRLALATFHEPRPRGVFKSRTTVVKQRFRPARQRCHTHLANKHGRCGEKIHELLVAFSAFPVEQTRTSPHFHTHVTEASRDPLLHSSRPPLPTHHRRCSREVCGP